VDVKVISMDTGDGQQFLNLLKGDNNQITDQIMRLLTGEQCAFVARKHNWLQVKQRRIVRSYDTMQWSARITMRPTLAAVTSGKRAKTIRPVKR
jgi:hypothetical protein